MKELKKLLSDVEESKVISPNTYEDIIDIFDVYPSDRYQVLYYTIGMNGEYDEFLEKFERACKLSDEDTKQDLTYEGGDVMWYLTRFLTGLQLHLEDQTPELEEVLEIPPDSTLMAEIFRTKRKLTETIKKFFRDGKGIMTEEWRDRIILTSYEFLVGLQTLGKEYKITLSDMMKHNILKLGSRKLRDKLHGDGDNR